MAFASPPNFSPWLSFDSQTGEFSIKNLAVFSFDNTLINCKSINAMMKLIDSNKYPLNLKHAYFDDDAILSSQPVFEILHQNNITKAVMVDFVKKLPEVPHMKLLIQKLHEHKYDIIIISEANNFFVHVWLEANGLSSKIMSVISHPADFNEEGMLVVDEYDKPNYDCGMSTHKLCKGNILMDFFNDKSKDNVFYEKVFYIGSNFNDFCPILRLEDNGIGCCRENYKLAEVAIKARRGELPNPYKLKNDIFIWKTGEDLIKYILDM